MYANKKLFLVTLQYQGYVLADDDYDAKNFTGNITNSERPTIKVEEVRSNVLRWPGYACIYHAEQYYRDINIDECFPPQTAELEVTEPKALGGHGASALSDLIEQLENAHVLIDRARAALAELEQEEPERLTVAQIKELPDNGENFIWEDPRGTGWIDLDGTFSRDDLQQLANSLPMATPRSEND